MAKKSKSKRSKKKSSKKTSSRNKKECNDVNCPFHGSLSTRGRTFEGKVTKARMRKTVIVEWERKHKIPKYERYEMRTSRVKAHVPSCMEVNEGDFVRIKECRPLSKTKRFVVVEKLKNEINKSESK